MNQTLPTCPKCQCPMEIGYSPDYSHGSILLGQWIRGQPQRSWLAMFGGLVIRATGRKPIPIRVYRCESCGLLESYAREEFEPK